jgi:hypothetical protein
MHVQARMCVYARFSLHIGLLLVIGMFMFPLGRTLPVDVKDGHRGGDR